MTAQNQQINMASQGCRGVPKILEKLENSIKDGNYYEAHQMYRTLYFRYLGQKKYKELKDMLYNGSVLFLEADQATSGADLGLLLIDVLVKSDDTDYVTWTPKLGTIFSKLSASNTTERDTFLAHAVRWSSKGTIFGSPLLHQSIAKIYWKEQNYSQARYHFIHSQDGKSCAKLLIEFQMAKGYKCEADLFIAQAVLQYLCLKNKNTANQTFATYTEQHPRIRKSGSGKVSQNKVKIAMRDILDVQDKNPKHKDIRNGNRYVAALKQYCCSKKLHTFAVLCEQYEPSIKRDPCYVQYLDKIGQIFFGLKPPQQQRGGIFGNFIESFLGGLDDDSDDDTPQASTSRQLIENSTDLD